jgi:glycosyltransferase involved in cell wall biosynthesis
MLHFAGGLLHHLRPHADHPVLQPALKTRWIAMRRAISPPSGGVHFRIHEAPGDRGSASIRPPGGDISSLQLPVRRSRRRAAAIGGGDYLLYVGNRHPHKNVLCMLEALRILQSDFPGLRAVVAGARMRPDDDVDAVLKNPELRAKVIEFPGASDGEILNLHTLRVRVSCRIRGGPPLGHYHRDSWFCRYSGDQEAAETPSVRQPDDLRILRCDPGAAWHRLGSAVRRGEERARRYANNNSLGQYLALFRRCLEAKA